MSGKKTPSTMMSASRLPSLLGLSKYMTPNDELHMSISAIKGELNNFDQNEAMAWGDRLEEIILLETSKRLQLTDLQTEFSTAFYHPTLPLACSLDGYADGRGQVIKADHNAGIYVIGAEQIVLEGFGVLEAKLTSVQAEEIPALYRGPVQLQAQMDIMQAKWGCVSVLYRGTELRLFLFEPHQQTLATIKAAVLEFQDKLEKYKATGAVDFYPPATTADADRMYPSTSGEAITLDVEAELLAQKIVDAKSRIAAAEADRAEAEKDLKTIMKTAPKGVAGKYEISWPMRNYAAQAAKTVPAKNAYSIRQSTLSIKEFKK